MINDIKKNQSTNNIYNIIIIKNNSDTIKHTHWSVFDTTTSPHTVYTIIKEDFTYDDYIKLISDNKQKSQSNLTKKAPSTNLGQSSSSNLKLSSPYTIISSDELEQEFETVIHDISKQYTEDIYYINSGSKVFTSTNNNITITMELPTIKGNPYKWTVKYNGKTYIKLINELGFSYDKFKELVLPPKDTTTLTPVSNKTSDEWIY
jgi:hypothetical protein